MIKYFFPKVGEREPVDVSKYLTPAGEIPGIVTTTTDSTIVFSLSAEKRNREKLKRFTEERIFDDPVGKEKKARTVESIEEVG